MGSYMTKQSNRNDYNLKEYVVDAAADVANLSTDCAPGSSCFVIATGQVYMLNTQKEWKEI